MNFSDRLRRALETDSPDDHLAVLAELGRMIASRLRAIEMWDQPPQFLGYGEVARWAEAYPADPEAHAEDYATAPPTLDFYTDRFVPALDGDGPLATVRSTTGDVAGYVAVMVRHFLIDRQRKQDPVGYAVFKTLEAVVQELARAGTAQLSDLHERKSKPGLIRRATRVRFPNPVGPRPTAPVHELVVAADTLRGNVHKLSKRGRGAQALLGPAVAALPVSGVEGFEFGELLVPLQAAVREAKRVWADSPTVIPAEVSGDGEIIPREIRKTAHADRYETFADRLDAVRTAGLAEIDAGKYQERSRVAMRRILGDWFAFLAEREADGAEHPTFEEWSRKLGVKLATLHDNFQRVRKIVERVLTAAGTSGE